MEFTNKIKSFSERVKNMESGILTEEATKTSIIMPFFQLLGYDIFNPNEFIPEFTADVGIKKGEKVDYAIKINDKPVIIIEAKWIGETLSKHDSQLFRYFGTTDVKFAILTNGKIYKFFTDLDQTNKMDEKPFLEIDLYNIKDSQIPELKKFSKEFFDENSIFNTASDLRFSNEFKTVFASNLDVPDDDFVRYFLSKTYSGVKTQNVIDKFKPVLKKSLNNFIVEAMNSKIKTALEEKDIDPVEKIENEVDDGIETTETELQGFYTIKAILSEFTDAQNIVYKDTKRYFAINFTNNTRKNICRLQFSEKRLSLHIPDENKEYSRYELSGVDNIYNYKNELKNSLMMFINDIN